MHNDTQPWQELKDALRTLPMLTTLRISITALDLSAPETMLRGFILISPAGVIFKPSNIPPDAAAAPRHYADGRTARKAA